MCFLLFSFSFFPSFDACCFAVCGLLFVVLVSLLCRGPSLIADVVVYFVIVRCLSFVVCCLMYVVCCLLFAAYCVRFVLCYGSCVLRCSLWFVCGLINVACCLLILVCCYVAC